MPIHFTAVLRAPVLGFLTVLLVSAVLLPAGSRADVEAGAIAKIGSLPRLGEDVRQFIDPTAIPVGFDNPKNPQRNFDSRVITFGTILMLAEVRQVWQVYPYQFAEQGTLVVVRDLDSFRITKTFNVPTRFRRGAGTNFGGDWMHTVDGARRVFLPLETNKLLEVDLRNFAMREHPLDPSLTGLGQAVGLSLSGVTYDAKEDAVFALYGFLSGGYAANTETFLYRVPLAAPSSAELRVVRSCNGPLPPSDNFGVLAFPVLLAPEFLYVPCQRAGLVGAVVRLARGDAMSSTSVEDVVIGPSNLEAAFADHRAARLYLITVGGEMWAFDAVAMSFVGVVAMNAARSPSFKLSYGFDPESGRVFFLSPTYGVGVVEARFFPIPQARSLPEHSAEGREAIYSDAKTGRFFVLAGTSLEKDLSYGIYQAGLAPQPPPPPDPDRNTVDRDEESGVTEARYFANATGYGTRVLLANGVSTVVPSPSIGPLSPIAQVIAKHVNSKCGFTDRELVVGRVTKTEYDTGSTAAAAIAADIDPRTKLDLERPSRCDVTLTGAPASENFKGIFGTAPAATDPGRDELDNVNQIEWKREPAACTSSEGGKPATARGDDKGRQSLGTSEVTCPLPGRAGAQGEMRGTAVGRLEGPVSVGYSSSETKVFRDGNGIHSEVTSIARDIDVADGALRIGEVRARATSRANGRPSKDPQSTHEIVIKRVKIGAFEVCAERCDPSAVAGQLNQILVGRVQIRVAGGLDDGLKAGTPKGALTAVQKSVQRQVSDRSLIGDFTTDVPALEIVVYNDNSEWGRARQVFQFAGVSSAATYNIALLPKGVALPDDPGDPGDPGTEGSEGAWAEAGSSSETALLTVSDGKDGNGGGILGAIRRSLAALVRGIRLFLTDPRRGLLVLTGWALFLAPAALARRRARLLAEG